MINKRIKRKGIFITEIIMSLTVLGMLIFVLVISLHGLAKFNLYQLVRMQCTAAAQAQLDSIAATGQPVSDEEFKRLWPKLDVSVEQTQGEVQWSGLKLIKVETKGMSYNTPVKISLSKYMELRTVTAVQEK